VQLITQKRNIILVFSAVFALYAVREKCRLVFGFEPEVLRLNFPVSCSPLSRGQASAFLLSCFYFPIYKRSCDGCGKAIVDINDSDARSAAIEHRQECR